MAPPARVLLLNERDARHPRAGGAEVHVTEIFRRLVERGHEVTLASSRFPGAARVDDVSGIRVLRLGPLRSYYPRAAWTCARETRRGRFDVVVECLNKVPFYAPVYARAPVLALCHHLFGDSAFLQVPWPVAAGVWSMERLIPLVYRRVPFVSISESTRNDLVARGVSPERVRVIHCGIRAPSLAPLPLARRRLSVVYVGRLERYKQIHVLLRAMARLQDRFPDAEIAIVGSGSDRRRLEGVAAELGLSARTRFTGFVSDAERDRLLAEARVSVCPSTKEGWGLTVIESNALATPVVATDAPGLRDSVEDGKTGFLAPDGDVDAFADRIGCLLGDDRRFDEMSAAALAWSRRFDWNRAADEMAESLDAARRSR